MCIYINTIFKLGIVVHAIIKLLMMRKKDAIGHQFFKEMKRAYTNLYYANSQKLGHVHTHQKMLI